MEATATRTRLTLLAACGTVLVVGAFLSLVLRGRSPEVMYGLFFFHNGPPAVLLWWLGRLVRLRQPDNRVGGLLLWVAGLATAHAVVEAFADAAIVSYGYTAAITADHPLVPDDMPLNASLPFFVMNWLWVPQVVLVVSVLPLLFPDGRLPGSPWRVGLWLSGAGCLALVAATAIDAWPTADWGTDRTPTTVVVLFLLGGGLVLCATTVAFTGLAVHWHRAPDSDRLPFRIVGTAVGLLALVAIATYPWQPVWVPAVLASFYVALAAYALAAARYRVHDLEPTLGRTAAAGVVSVFVAGVYVGVMVGLGSLVSRQVEDRILPVVAVAAVGLLILPLHRWVRRTVDRLVYRRRGDRTTVVSTLAHRTSSSPARTVLEETVQLLLRSTGARGVEARLADGSVVAAGDAEARAFTRTAEISHAGERLGVLALRAHAQGDLSRDARSMLDDVAHLLAVALHNDRLTADLQARIAELAASRRRIVSAQDQARRSLERDLHDGAQAQLVGLRLQVGALQAAGSPLDGLAASVDEAIHTLREISRGVLPPMLEEAGPGAALVARLRSLGVPVSVETDQVRHDLSIELTLYYATLEAAQNAVRHGGAAHVAVRIHTEASRVTFAVRDDGCGFDPATSRSGTGLGNIEDRVRALDGDVVVTSTPGEGTTVSGSIPTHPPDSDK